MRARFFVVASLVLVACSRRSSPPPLDENWTVVIPDAGAPFASASSAPPVLDATIAKPDDDAGANDFEDQFAYGEFDAGKGDPSMLTKKSGFDPYANPRFGFSLDVPRALDAMPAPDNGDGMQWRLGSLVSMTASGMNYMPELGGTPLCTISKSVVAHNESKSGCFSTGKHDGFIFWERYVIARDIVFSLRFQYAESVKGAMDPIVTHVNASWKH
jgi:hypothetical protein